MKDKIKLYILLGVVGILGAGVLNLMPARASLWNFYSEIGQQMPSVEERAETAAEFGIWGYRGTYEQNVLLEERLRDYYNVDFDDYLGFSVISRFKTTLASSMTATQTTVPLSSITTFDGTTITMSLLGGVEVFFTIEPGSSREEIVRCTAISSTSFTGCTRGLAFSGSSKSSVAANRKTHNAGSVVVMSNTHYVFENLLDIDSDKTASGTLKLADGSATTTLQMGPDNNTYDKCIEITNGDTDSPRICYDEDAGSDGLGRWILTHDGVNTHIISTTTAGNLATGGLGIDITAGTVKVDTAVTSTSGMGYSGAQLVNVLSGGSGLEFLTDGMGVATTSDFAWTGNNSFTGNVTTTNVTSTQFFSDVVSTTALFIDSVSADQLIDGTTLSASVHSHDNFSELLDLDTDTKTVSNNTNELSIASSTIPANLLGSGNGVEFSIYVSDFKLASSANAKITLKYGSTAVASFTLTEASAADVANTQGEIKGVLFADGSTSAQYGDISAHFAPNYSSGNAQSGFPTDVFWGQAFGTGAEDSTGALDFDVTIDYSAASANSAITVRKLLLKAIKT